MKGEGEVERGSGRRTRRYKDVDPGLVDVEMMECIKRVYYIKGVWVGHVLSIM